MGQVILEPLDAPELSEFLLVDVFTSISTPGKKEGMKKAALLFVSVTF